MSSTRDRSGTKETGTLRREYLDSGEKMVNDYIFLKLLGRGSYGKVKLARHFQSNDLVAVKIINKNALKKKRVGRFGNALQDVKKEIAILKKLNHPNIVRLFEVIDDPNEHKLYMVFEYVPGGTIQELAVDAQLSEEVARRYFAPLLSAVEYVHSMNIVHRDIKPENILAGEDGEVKLSDFGVSSIHQEADEDITKTAGTPSFFPPEVCSGKAYKGPPVDVWALGVTLYSMVFGKVPFTAANEFMLYSVIQTQPLVFPEDIPISNELMDLITRMLEKDPSKRIVLSAAMTHQWLNLGEGSQTAVEVTDDEVNKAFSRVEEMVDQLRRFVGIKLKLKSKAANARDRNSLHPGRTDRSASMPPQMAHMAHLASKRHDSRIRGKLAPGSFGLSRSASNQQDLQQPGSPDTSLGSPPYSPASGNQLALPGRAHFRNLSMTGSLSSPNHLADGSLGPIAVPATALSPKGLSSVTDDDADYDPYAAALEITSP